MIGQCGEGWSVEELAELDRAQSVLSGTGRMVDRDGGLSDMGEPWMVFCDRDGRVLLHIARIGQKYFCDGVGLARPRTHPSSSISDVLNALRPIT
jgi:hypothetical protein